MKLEISTGKRIFGLYRLAFNQFLLLVFMSKELHNDQQVTNATEESSYLASHLKPKVQSKIQPKVSSKIQAKLMTGIGKKKEIQSEKSLSGQQLPEEVQAKMENSFGQDFGGVKIHTDSTKAENINAKAYTQGNAIHFAPGEYNPASQQGQELIGHELTHVVQQGQGKVGKGEIHGKGLEINKDASLEQEADESGKKAALGETINLGNSALPPSGDDQPVQRFEAKGHEAAERTALTSGSKMSNEEASMVYYGNWMRDMNQALVPSLAESLTPDIVFVIINFLGYKKFGRYMNAEEFGYYIPAEHLDNPAGQLPGKQFDYYNSPPAINKEMYKDVDSLKTSTWAPRPADFTTPQADNDPQTGTVLGANLFSVDQNGVMAHIRRTNLHVEDRLQYAAQKGRTPEGMMHLGAALHSVEDLFAHSNYVEIAIDQLLKEDKTLLPTLEPENRSVRKLTSSVDNTLTPEAGDKMPVLTTGTFLGADTLQSVGAEGIKMLREGLGEVKTDAEKAAQDGLMDKIVLSVDNNPTLKKKVVDSLFAPLIPDYLKSTIVPTLYNTPLYGAYTVMKMIPSIPIPLDDIKNVIRKFINNNLLKPAAEQIEARLLVSKVQDTPLYKVEGENNKVIEAGGNVSSPMNEISSSITGEKPNPAEELAKAKKKKELFDKTPKKVMANASHSQLAKDHSNSIFFGLAFGLAVEADKMLRDEMLKFWDANKITNPDDAILSKDPNTLDKEGKNTQQFVQQRKNDDKKILDYGNQVYNDGHEAGQSYNLQEIRDDSANNILLVASTLDNIKNAGDASLHYLGIAKGMVGKANFINTDTKNLIKAGINKTEKGVNVVIAENNKIELEKVSLEFRAASDMVRTAKTLEAREAAYKQLLLARQRYIDWVVNVFKSKDPKFTAYGMGFYLTFATVIDKELAAVAPAYPQEQINLLSSAADPLSRSVITLPSLKGNKYESLLMASRKIIDHPYASTWWKPYVASFMRKNSTQIMDEIRARNAGYAHFEGEHHH